VSTPWKILVVASRDAEVQLVRDALQQACKAAEFILVHTGAEMLRALDQGLPDAVLITSHVSHMHLAHTLAEARRHAPSLPVFLVAGAGELPRVLEIVKTGITGVVPIEALSLLAPTLMREIQHAEELRANEARQRRLQWLESAIGAAPLALAIIDNVGAIRWANRAYCVLVGVSTEQIASGKARLWPVGEDRWAEVREVLHAGRLWRGSIASDSAETEASLQRLSIAELPREDGASWYIAIRHEPTAEENRTPEQIAAMQRHELFAAIAGGIAHDLNNILAPITMAANILGEQNLSDENCELVHTIEHSAARGAAVIRQVLTFAQGSDNCEMALQPRYLLHEITRLAAEIFPSNIGVRADVPPSLWHIVGDPAEVHQALVNVLLNARDAMPEGGNITIIARNRTLASLPSLPFFNPMPGDFVEITVEDTGPGIDPEVATRVWEPFVTTKGMGQGAGLGLSRVAGVLRSHGGFGEMHTRADHGTLVSLYFPRGDAAPAPASTDSPELARRDIGRILVVDDEDSILTLSRRILERAGYEVLVASNGREALNVFMRHHNDINLVITDLAMPEMNGFTLVWALRRSKPDLRVMVVTGQGTEANLNELKLMGVHEVLMKPFTSRQLLDTVARTQVEPVCCEPDLFLDAMASGA
jgi:signal transduction histidine kinase/DNA-binding response OmpR family regulator